MSDDLQKARGAGIIGSGWIQSVRTEAVCLSSFHPMIIATQVSLLEEIIRPIFPNESDDFQREKNSVMYLATSRGSWYLEGPTLEMADQTKVLKYVLWIKSCWTIDLNVEARKIISCLIVMAWDMMYIHFNT